MWRCGKQGMSSQLISFVLIWRGIRSSSHSSLGKWKIRFLLGMATFQTRPRGITWGLSGLKVHLFLPVLESFQGNCTASKCWNLIWNGIFCGIFHGIFNTRFWQASKKNLYNLRGRRQIPSLGLLWKVFRGKGEHCWGNLGVCLTWICNSEFSQL